MGAYSYKEVMYRGDFQKAIKPCMESCGATEGDYDGDANYDGDAWIVTAFLLEEKDREIATLTARVRELEAENAKWREACAFASHKLESARIWGGLSWHWNPLSPVHYRPAYDMLRSALGE